MGCGIQQQTGPHKSNFKKPITKNKQRPTSASSAGSTYSTKQRRLQDVDIRKMKQVKITNRAEEFDLLRPIPQINPLLNCESIYEIKGGSMGSNNSYNIKKGSDSWMNRNIDCMCVDNMSDNEDNKISLDLRKASHVYDVGDKRGELEKLNLGISFIQSQKTSIDSIK
ncbi:Hypothetical_protein [Hexamita inflata]|uniref:Hypothetical_protein n=1 Tax=Hexamita inflata TaxID=28002 RepID=A0AA86RE39_9EUKA|nr:Hypothetical protein HINF_LOCUS2247 [Hexamita inflata]CAI9970699.1 Hypothetical protein HINF_LOCUS58344 [Hexamita inflata]CAI9976253.1 Hypothetical protein HINF_LOCUS63898 [Hexamita inflata]